MVNLRELKAWYIKELKLPVADPDKLDENAPLELDSVDVVVLSDAVERDFGPRIETVSEARRAFVSLRGLAAFLEEFAVNGNGAE
jgi:acyl carrier protein